MKKGVCAHCKLPRWLHGRNLCRRCYQTPEIHCQYRPLIGEGSEREPTEEELQATIAEQRKKLPKWWFREEANKLLAAVPPEESRVVLMGRGLRARMKRENFE